MLVIDCAKLLSLTMKSLALGNMDMLVERQIDDESRKLLNSCQRVNAGHKLSYRGEFFPCLIFLLQMILPLNLVLWQVHCMRNGNAVWHERIVSNRKGFNDCRMRVLCEGKKAELCIAWMKLLHWSTQDAAWKCCVEKGVENRVFYV